MSLLNLKQAEDTQVACLILLFIKRSKKTAFWRSLSYFFIFAGLFFVLILLLTIFSPKPPLQILEITPKGKVLFTGSLEQRPIDLHQDRDLSLSEWQKFIDQKFYKKIKG